jgi:hypothetical protein
MFYFAKAALGTPNFALRASKGRWGGRGLFILKQAFLKIFVKMTVAVIIYDK